MEYRIESSLEDFKAWSGGKDTLEVLKEKGDVDEVEQLLMELYGSDMTETQINDILWFERDWLAEMLGYADWDEYEYGKKDEEDEE